MTHTFRQIFLTTVLVMVTILANAHDFKEEGIFYTITSPEKLTVEVTYKGGKYDSSPKRYVGDISIPASVVHKKKTYTVTRISSEAFWGCTGLTSVTIPNSVTSIGAGAFFNCTCLTSVTIEDGMADLELGTKAFNNTSLQTLYMGRTCSGTPFSEKATLASLTIGNSVTSIGENAFKNCTGLTNVDIPNNVTTIGDGAFEGCI